MKSDVLDPKHWKIGPGQIVLVFYGGPMDGHALVMMAATVKDKTEIEVSPGRFSEFVPNDDGQLQFMHIYSLPKVAEAGKVYAVRYLRASRR